MSTSERQSGHERPSGESVVDWIRQRRQKEWPQRSVSGSTRNERQTGQPQPSGISSAVVATASDCSDGAIDADNLI